LSSVIAETSRTCTIRFSRLSASVAGSSIFLLPNPLFHYPPCNFSSELLNHVGEGAGAPDLSAALQRVEIIHVQVNAFLLQESTMRLTLHDGVQCPRLCLCEPLANIMHEIELLHYA
jgi:hypothetical protein